MARTWKNEKRPTAWYKDPSRWRKEANRPYRARMKRLLRSRKHDEIPISFEAHWKRDARGWFW